MNLGVPPGHRSCLVEIQRVDDAPRYHVDFPADDIEKEVARMDSLGATRINHHVDGWWVMRRPPATCVVRA